MALVTLFVDVLRPESKFDTRHHSITLTREESTVRWGWGGGVGGYRRHVLLSGFCV